MSFLHRTSTGYIHYCPGCDTVHELHTDVRNECDAIWTFNGQPDAPTFSPSVNVGRNTNMQCHYFIENGQIRYLSDCWHEFANSTVSMEELPEWATQE